MEIGTEISQKIRAAIKAKLIELGSYVDEELPDYIMVMVANKKTEQQMGDDLNLFLGLNTDKFTTWLHGLLGRLQAITSDSAPTAAQQSQVPSTEQIPKTSTEQVTVTARTVQSDKANKTSAASSSTSNTESRHDRTSVITKPIAGDTPTVFQSQGTTGPVMTARKSSEHEPLFPISTSPGASAEKKTKQEAEPEDASMRKVIQTSRKRKGRSMMSCISVPASSTIQFASKSKVPKIQSQPSTSTTSKTDSHCKSGDHCDSTGSVSLHVTEVQMADAVTTLPTSEGIRPGLKLEPITPATKPRQTIPVTKLKSITPATKLGLRQSIPVTKIEPTTLVTKLEPTTPVTKLELATPVTKLELTTPVTKLEPTTPVTKLEPTTPVTKLEPTTPVTKLEPTTPVTKLEPTTPVTKLETASPVINIVKTSPVVNIEPTRLCPNTDPIRRPENEVIDIVSDDSNSQIDVIGSEIIPSTRSLPDVVSSVSGHSTIIAVHKSTEPQSEEVVSDVQYKNNSEIITKSRSILTVDPKMNLDAVIPVSDSLPVHTNQITSEEVMLTEQTMSAQSQPEEGTQTLECNQEAVVRVRRAVIVEERFGIRKKKQDVIVNAVTEIKEPSVSQSSKPQSDQSAVTVHVQSTDEPELLVREETDEFSEEFQTEPEKVVASHKSRQHASQRHQTQAETRHHRHHKHGRDSQSTKNATPDIVPASELVITLPKTTAASSHKPSKTSHHSKSRSLHLDSVRHPTSQASCDVAKVGRQVSPVSSMKITRTFHSHEQPAQSVIHRQPVHQRLTLMAAPATHTEKGVSKSAHGRRKKQQISSVVGTVKQMPNLEPPQEIEEEEYDPYNPAVGNVASVIRVTPRRQLPASLQANKSLLLKAVTEANKSVKAYKPAQTVRKGGGEFVTPVQHQKQQYHRQTQKHAVQGQVYHSAMSHRLGITSRSRHKGILDLAHARGEHDPMTSSYEYPIQYQPLTVAVRQDVDDVILIGMEEPDRRVKWDDEDEIVVEDEEDGNVDHVEREEEVIEKRLVKRAQELTDDDDEDDDDSDSGDDNSDDDDHSTDNTDVVIKHEKHVEEDEEEEEVEHEEVKDVEEDEQEEEKEEEDEEEDDELLLDDPSSSQDEQQLVMSEKPTQHVEEDAGNVEVIFSQADITVSPDETISQDEALSQDEQTEEEQVKSQSEKSDDDQSVATLTDNRPVSLPHVTEAKSSSSKSSHRVPRSRSDTAVIRPRVEPLSVRSRASVKPVSVPAFQRLGEEPDSRLFIEQDAQPPVVRTAPSRLYARQPIQHANQQKIQYIQHSPVIESANNYQIIQHVYPNPQYDESSHQNPSYFPPVRQSYGEQTAFHTQMPVRQPSIQIPTSQFTQLAPQQQYFQKPPPVHYYQKPPQLSPHEYLLSAPPFVGPPPVLPQADTYQPMRAPATTHIQPQSLPVDNKPSTRFVVTLDGVNSADYEEKMDVEYDDDGEESVSGPAVPEVKPTATHESATVACLSPVQSEVDMSVDDDSGKKPSSCERCRFWPACSSGNTCQFHHPSMPCKTFPNCKFGEKCLYIHPNCKYDATCARKDCPFTHASKRKSLHSAIPKYVPVPQSVVFPAPPTQPPAVNSKSAICRFYPKCTNMNCPFPHPQPCRFGFNCGNRSTCSYYHPSLPNPDKLKWVASSTQSRNMLWSKNDSVSGGK